MAPSAEPPSTHRPTTNNNNPPSTHPRLPSRISLAPDILPTPFSPQRRYAAYLRARHRFWDSFPGGQYARLATPGTDLECGFHALVLSARHQFPAGVRVPTLRELRGVWEREVGGRGGWLRADEVAAVFSAWGGKYLSGGGGSGGEEEEEEGGDGGGGGGGRRRRRWRCQMGWVTDGGVEGDEMGWPVMMNTPEVETGEVGEDILRVWVWNDGMSLAGGVGHFEGIRGLTREEREEVVGRAEGGEDGASDKGGGQVGG